MWAQLQTARGIPLAVHEEEVRYGRPVITLPRLGQGSFRVLVTDAYDRRCALTNERTLPALDAAHIKPYSAEGTHRVDNGLLMRRDLHALFDRGYVTVTPDMQIESAVASGRNSKTAETTIDFTVSLYDRPVKLWTAVRGAPPVAQRKHLFGVEKRTEL